MTFTRRKLQGCRQRDAGSSKPLHDHSQEEVEEELRELKRALGE